MNHTDILRKLNSHGHQAYVVGGAVRDRLLGLPVSDYDLATNASIPEVCNLFAGAQAKVLPSRAKAPVASLYGYEIASFRKESGSRHEAIFEPGTLEEDAFRRDFPVNALYEDADGNVLDPTGRGLAQIEAKVISILSNGTDEHEEWDQKFQRIAEDPTRVLRTYRLAAQLGFEIDGFSRQVIRNFMALYHYNPNTYSHEIAPEQVGRELKKLLSVESSKNLAKAVRLMHEDGLNYTLFPELHVLAHTQQGCAHHQEGNVLKHTLMVLEAVPNDPIVRLAALYHDAGKPATQARKADGSGYSFHGHEKVSGKLVWEMMEKYKVFSMSSRVSVRWLVENHMRAHMIPDLSRPKQAKLLRNRDAHRLIALVKADTLGRIPCAAPKWEKLMASIDEFYSVDKTLTDLKIDGKLLISLGEKPGPKLGNKLYIMSNLLDKNPHLTRKQLLEAVGLNERTQL